MKPEDALESTIPAPSRSSYSSHSVLPGLLTSRWTARHHRLRPLATRRRDSEAFLTRVCPKASTSAAPLSSDQAHHFNPLRLHGIPRALEDWEKAVGNEYPFTLMSVSNLASALLYQGKYEAAEAMTRGVLDGREKALGKEHPDTLASVNILASVLQEQGKHEAVEAMNRQVLEGGRTF
ncbi:hypothetical protein LTS10_013340 [Elasticomyces elasticus]|nr:hypothetical protein LTS10_013340 [Elasticomyces elasticus]